MCCDSVLGETITVELIGQRLKGALMLHQEIAIEPAGSINIGVAVARSIWIADRSMSHGQEIEESMISMGQSCQLQTSACIKDYRHCQIPCCYLFPI